AAMARDFVRCSLSDAIDRLAPRMRVLLPPGCGEPQALVDAVCRQAERLAGLVLVGGIHLGEYPFLRTEPATLRYVTWHMSPKLEEARHQGRGEVIPPRYFDLVTQFAPRRSWAPGRRFGPPPAPACGRLPGPRSVPGPRASCPARGPARHCPGESEHAAHVRHRFPAPDPDRRLGGGGRATRPVSAAPRGERR